MKNEMNIVVSVNNTPTEVAANATLSEVLLTCGYLIESTTFAVAVNSVFVPRQQYRDTRLNSHDLIDVVQPISGG